MHKQEKLSESDKQMIKEFLRWHSQFEDNSLTAHLHNRPNGLRNPKLHVPKTLVCTRRRGRC